MQSEMTVWHGTELKCAKLSFNATGALISPASGKRLHILGLLLVPDSSCVITLQGKAGATITDLTGAMTLAGPLYLPPVKIEGNYSLSLWSLAADEQFYGTLGTSVHFGGSAWYIER